MRDHLSDNEQRYRQTMREFDRVLGTSLGTNVTRNAPSVEGRKQTAGVHSFHDMRSPKMETRTMLEKMTGEPTPAKREQDEQDAYEESRMLYTRAQADILTAFVAQLVADRIRSDYPPGVGEKVWLGGISERLRAADQRNPELEPALSEFTGFSPGCCARHSALLNSELPEPVFTSFPARGFGPRMVFPRLDQVIQWVAGSPVGISPFLSPFAGGQSVTGRDGGPALQNLSAIKSSER
jgi:hypothetical protein